MGGPPEYQSLVLTAASAAAVLALLLVILLPLLHRRRRKRAQRGQSEKIEAAIAKILEDGVVEGPKGPYVPHRRTGVRTEPWPTNETRPPKGNSFHGMPWP